MQKAEQVLLPQQRVSRDNLPPEMQNLPSIFDAVKRQLGLKLEAQRGPVEYYVIDNVDQPSAN